MLPGSRYMFDRTTATRASMASFLPESRCTFDADAPPVVRVAHPDEHV
jgi:hypothetical protein